MKTKQIVEVYNTLNGARLSKMDDKDKFLVIKAMRQLKPIATSYGEFVQDAQERLKGDGFEDIQKKARQWQEEGESTTLSLEERRDINVYLNDYGRKVEECVAEEAGKENELDYVRLAEEAFGKLVASNDFDVKTIMLLQDALMVMPE